MTGNPPAQITRRPTKVEAVAHNAADMTRRMVCGGLAGMIAKTATNPLERIKMLSQTGEHGSAQKKSIISLYRDILHKEGVLGLWAGNGANLLRVFPSKAIVFSSNDVYKRGLRKLFHVPEGQAIPGPLAFLAGGMSGMSATAMTYPLDFARGRISGKLASEAGKKQYKGIINTIIVSAKEEGVFALYKGVTPTIMGAMPYEGIKFGTVGVCEKLFPSEDKKPSPIRKMLFGGLGGVLAGLITYPNDTVRRMMQLQGSRGTTTEFTGYWDCVRKTYARHGIQRFYHGVFINIVRMAPNSAVQFGSYELLKQFTADMF